MPNNDKKEILFFVVSRKTIWENEQGIQVKQEMT